MTTEPTARELQVVALAAEGLTNKDIAEALRISPNTVKVHLANLSVRLGFRGRLRLASWYRARQARERLGTNILGPS